MFDINYLVQDDWLAYLLTQSYNLALNLKHKYICSHHLLSVLSKESEIINKKLLTTLDSKEIELELSRLNYEEIESTYKVVNLKLLTTKNSLVNDCQFIDFSLSETLINILKTAKKYSLYLDLEKINENHLFMSFLDNNTSLANKAIESTGTNQNSLKQTIIQNITQDLTQQGNPAEFKNCVVKCLKKIITWYENLVDNVNELSLPQPSNQIRREEIAFKVMEKYLTELIQLQLNLRRFALEHQLKIIDKQVGPLSDQIQSSIVSLAAQNIRSQVKQIIEYMFSHECHLFHDMPNESEYEQIGLIVEDLWWSYGEALALEDLYCLAIEDHRRKHLLDLQKNKLDICEKLTNLKTKLVNTSNQLFKKHPVLKTVQN